MNVHGASPDDNRSRASPKIRFLSSAAALYIVYAAGALPADRETGLCAPDAPALDNWPPRRTLTAIAISAGANSPAGATVHTRREDEARGKALDRTSQRPIDEQGTHGLRGQKPRRRASAVN